MENKNNNKKNKKTEIQKKLDERPPCHIITNGKHTIYFLFLKGFIDISFVKTVRCISFLLLFLYHHDFLINTCFGLYNKV